ncbi:MAG: EamA family transporter [Firmicutes bacterium]|nr:EamA family transporter [Bacillota bacterium]
MTAFLLLLTAVAWGLAFPFIKTALLELPPAELTLMRMVTALLAFIVYFLIKGGFPKVEKKDLPRLFLLGSIGIACYHLSLNYGEQYVNAGTASLIIASDPIFIALAAGLLLREKITSRQGLGIAIAFAGLFTIVLTGPDSVILSPENLLGTLAVCGSALCFVFYTIFGKEVVEKYGALTVTAYNLFFAALVLLLPLGASTARLALGLSLPTWGSILFLGVFSTMMAYTFWYKGMEAKGAAGVAVYLYLVPLFALVGSQLLIGEKITLLTLIGGLLVISGVYLNNSATQIKAKRNPLARGTK